MLREVKLYWELVYAFKGSYIDIEIVTSLFISGYSKRKEFAPSGSKFFSVRVAPFYKGPKY